MKTIQFSFVLFIMIVTMGCNSTPTSTQMLTTQVDLINSESQKIGTVTLTEVSEGVEVQVDATGLPPGKHGFHIHETGICQIPDFKSADGHFNPHQKQHGTQNPEGSHAGDLDNITVDEHGKVQITKVAKKVTLKEGEPHSLKKEGGTSIIIHEDEDDLTSDPTGNAGNRIACGEIK